MRTLGINSFMCGLSETVEVQSRHVQKACNAYMSETSKIGEMFLEIARKASRPVEETPKRFT